MKAKTVRKAKVARVTKAVKTARIARTEKTEKSENPERRRFDYKRPEELEQYLDDYGKIKSRRETKLTAEEQRRMAKAVKRAKHLALL